MIMRPMRPVSFALIALIGVLPALAQPLAQRDLDRLGSEDTAQSQQARSSIITAISDPNMAVAERLDASRQVIEAVRTMIQSEDENTVVNGLMIAGHMVTPEAVGLIEGVYTSDKPGVRYAGMRAARTTLRILGQQRTTTLAAPEVQRQITAAGELLRSDPDPFVAEGAARTLIQAAKLTESKLLASAEAAFVELAKGASSRLTGIGELPEEKREGVLRIAMMSTFELGRLLQPGALKPGQESVREAAGLAGDALAYAYKRFQDANRQIGSINPEESTKLAQLIGSSESLIYYALGALNQPAEQPQLRATFEAGNDRDFNRIIVGFIGGTGLLTRPPFSLSADRFVVPGG